MALVSQASRRYAEALVESVGAANLPSVVTEVTSVAEALEAHADLKNVLMNPAFSTDERFKVLDAVMGHLSLSEQTRRFVRLVAEKNRIGELDAIAESVRQLAQNRSGQVKATVESASELPSSTQEQLRRALEKRTGMKVELEVTVRPELIGGIRAQVGSLVLDGTIKSELDRLKDRLNTAEN